MFEATWQLFFASLIVTRNCVLYISNALSFITLELNFYYNCTIPTIEYESSILFAVVIYNSCFLWVMPVYHCINMYSILFFWRYKAHMFM